MRLIIEYDHGSQDAYAEVVRPIIYESKDKFLEDFESGFNKIEVKDLYDYQSFKVGGHEFSHDEHRIIKFKDHPDMPKYLDYGNVANSAFQIRLPEVYTVDEWFDEVENE